MFFNPFIPKCKYCGVLSHFKRYSTTIANHEVISDLLGIPTNEAVHYVNKQKLRHKDTQLLIQSIQYCQSIGFKNDDILWCPMLMRQHPLCVEQHHLSMKEGGFTHIDPEVLARAIHYMRKEVLSLKKSEIIMEETDVARSFVKHIDNKEIADKVYKRHTDDTPWNIVHMNILKSFLKWRLNASEDDIVRLFRVHKMIKNKSFKVIQENIAIAEELGFDTEKILKNGFLLNNYPKYARTILEDFSHIAGADLRKAIKQHPKLIMRPPSNFIKIYGILKEFEIPDELIRRKISIFLMSPDTVKTRLKTIESDPDMKVLLKHPKILELIFHHQKVQKRLSFLQHLKLRCASLTVLGTKYDDVFEEYVREGKDVNHPSDLMVFLKNLFKTDDPNLREKLKKHPYYLRIPLKDMLETYNFLVHRKFHPMHIYKVIHILLYPKTKIYEIIKRLRAGEVPEVKYRLLNQVDKLNLILYMMEKEHHFTGNGVWLSNQNKTESSFDIPEEDDLSDSLEQPDLSDTLEKPEL